MTAFDISPDDFPAQLEHRAACDDSTELELPTVRISDPQQLQRAVPHLIGFHPSRSLIAIGLAGESNRIRLAARIDAPVSHDDAEAAGQQLGLVLGRAGASVAVMTYFDEPDDVDAAALSIESWVCFERTRAMEAELAAGLEAAGLHPRFAWPQEPWSVEPGTSVLEAATIAVGRRTYRSRADVESLLEPLGGMLRTEVAELLEELQPLHFDTWELVDAVFQLLDQLAAVEAADEPAPRFLPADLALCCLAAEKVPVRDVLLTLMASDSDVLSAGVWLEAARRAPTRYVAPVATIAAMCAYLRGEGVLAACAVDRALSVDPDYHLAQLVERSLRGGIPPDDIAAMLRSCTDSEGFWHGESRRPD